MQLSTKIHLLQSESSQTAQKFFNMTSQLRKTNKRERGYQLEIELLKSRRDVAIIQQEDPEMEAEAGVIVV